ncbi:hypothetical protein QQ73_03110 [Candidatus Endoriftia persephone str. Guaymas]|nr:hypothetical protein [Candidatus Endoriftia persephone str. Guaymas]
MKILLSNDDGFQAPGLAALTESLSPLGEIVVVAPERNRSGASNSLTLELPLRAHTHDNGFVSVDGTPTDCVHLADPRGKTIYWVGPAGAEQDAGPGTDFYAVREGYVSVTPLQVDLTRHSALDSVGAWLA